MWRAALRYSAVGLEMGVAVLVGYGAGWWLDKKFGTKPYLSLVMLLVGIAAGFLALIRVAKEVGREEERSKQDGTKPPEAPRDDGDAKR
ncbi:MAG: AtpZ/AtpI family protein [Deltaproteobacteria bacterium]|nr:AtpZ/AtpI family protein [Deltaproteobacteria bacterium]